MQVERLTPDTKPEVMNVLAEAFRDYPVMRFILKTEGPHYDSQLNSVVSFYCEKRFAGGGHVLGVREGERLAGVVLVDEAIQKPWEEREAALLRLKEEIGEAAFARLELYETMSSKAEPDVPHYFLGMIGVRPEHQGKGYSRILMERVAELSTRDPRSTGVCLSTELPSNVALYERFGYAIISEVDLGELHSWCMFLPTLPHKRIS